MSQVRAGQGPLTTDQWTFVVGALPAAKSLARSMVRRCPGLDVGEVETLLQDGLMKRVRDYEPSHGTTLMQYARNLLILDLLRAARRRARDPIVTAGLRALDIHEETLASPDLAVQFAESVEEKLARAQNLADEMIAAAYYGYEHARNTPNQEDEVAARARWEELKGVADGAGQNGAALMDLIYVEDMTWKAVSDRLGISEATAKRLEGAIIERLRAFLARERS